MKDSNNGQFCSLFCNLLSLSNKCETLELFFVEHAVDENVLEEKLAEELLEGWQVVPTGSGFLVTTAWRWPTGEPARAAHPHGLPGLDEHQSGISLPF